MNTSPLRISFFVVVVASTLLLRAETPLVADDVTLDEFVKMALTEGIDFNEAPGWASSEQKFFRENPRLQKDAVLKAALADCHALYNRILGARIPKWFYGNIVPRDQILRGLARRTISLRDSSLNVFNYYSGQAKFKPFLERVVILEVADLNEVEKSIGYPPDGAAFKISIVSSLQRNVGQLVAAYSKTIPMHASNGVVNFTYTFDMSALALANLYRAINRKILGADDFFVLETRDLLTSPDSAQSDDLREVTITHETKHVLDDFLPADSQTLADYERLTAEKKEKMARSSSAELANIVKSEKYATLREKYAVDSVAVHLHKDAVTARQDYDEIAKKHYESRLSDLGAYYFSWTENSAYEEGGRYLLWKQKSAAKVAADPAALVMPSTYFDSVLGPVEFATIVTGPDLDHKITFRVYFPMLAETETYLRDKLPGLK